MKRLNFVILTICLINLVACNFETEEIVRQKELEYITVDTTYAQTDYALNTEFKKQGYKVIGHYSDDSEVEENIKFVDFDGFDSTNINENLTMTATFRGKTASFQVRISAVRALNLEIQNYPKKLYYLDNEPEVTDNHEFSKCEGLQIGLCQSDGQTRTLTSSEYKLIYSEAQKAIVVTYPSNSEIAPINVPIRVLPASKYNSLNDYCNNINVNYDVLIEKYKKGQKIDFEGILIQIKNSKNKQVDSILNGQFYADCREIPADYTDNQMTVHVTVNNCTTSFVVNVVQGFTVGADLLIADDYYTNNSYGQKLSFNSNLFTFRRLFDNEKNPVTIDLGKETASLRYSTENLSAKEVFDKNKGKPITEDLDLNWKGKKTIYFYYKYKAERDNSDQYFPFSKDFIVQEPLFKGIEAIYKNLSKETTSKGVYEYIPVSADPNLKNYITVKTVWTDSKQNKDLSNDDYILTYKKNDFRNNLRITDFNEVSLKISLNGVLKVDKSIIVKIGPSAVKNITLNGTEFDIKLEDTIQNNEFGNIYKYTIKNTDSNITFEYENRTDSPQKYFYTTEQINKTGDISVKMCGISSVVRTVYKIQSINIKTIE